MSNISIASSTLNVLATGILKAKLNGLKAFCQAYITKNSVFTSNEIYGFQSLRRFAWNHCQIHLLIKINVLRLENITY